MSSFSLYLTVFALTILTQTITGETITLVDKLDSYGLAGLIILIFLREAVPLARKLVEGRVTSKQKVEEMKAQEELFEAKTQMELKVVADERQVKALENLTVTLGNLNQNMTVVCERIATVHENTQYNRNGITRIETFLGTVPDLRKRQIKNTKEE